MIYRLDDRHYVDYRRTSDRLWNAAEGRFEPSNAFVRGELMDATDMTELATVEAETVPTLIENARAALTALKEEEQ